MMFLTELRPMNWAGQQTQAQIPTPNAKSLKVRTPENQLHAFQPCVSLFETAETYTIQMELPGVNPETIDLVLQNDELTIRGAKTPETTTETQWHLNERGFGPFERRFRFATPVQQDGIAAETRFGVLTVRVAKAKEALPKKIQVIARA